MPTILTTQPAPSEPMTLPAHVMACPQCGLHVTLPALGTGEEAVCPRCDEHLVSIPRSPIDEPLAFAWTSLILLFLACSFPLLAIDVQGNQTQISLLQNAEAIYRRDFALLANVLLLCVLLLPGLFLLTVIYLFSGIRAARPA
jgi:paraquat-inducible protein A